MRIRTVKPEFWTHPVMARLPAEDQLIAIGLLNIADDAGYFLSDPSLVRSAICPFKEASKQVQDSLDRLVLAEWIEIRIHQTHGPIGCVINFKKHQRINKPTQSKLVEYFDNSTSHTPLLNESRSGHVVLPEDYAQERKGKEGNGGERKGLIETQAFDLVTQGVKEKPSRKPPDPEAELVKFLADLSEGEREIFRTYEAASGVTLGPDWALLKMVRQKMKAHPVDELCAAIKGHCSDPWNREKKRYSLRAIFSDASVIASNALKGRGL